MLTKIVVIFMALLFGFGVGFIVFSYMKSPNFAITRISMPFMSTKREVVGFLPYWLIPNANKDYMKYITTLTYFGLTVSENGSIQKKVSDVEEEPGWTALRTGKVDKFLNEAKNNNKKLSLLVFSADEETIARLMDDPVLHAKNMMDEVGPIMKRRGFTDLNLDIESVSVASLESQLKFTAFVREVRRHVDEQKLGTVTIDVSPIVLFKEYLVDLDTVAELVDHIVFMTYDFHYMGSSVTGAVSPVGGAGLDAEFDTEVSIAKALDTIPKEKILIGAPLYGYQWETIGNTPGSGVLPGSGLTASSRRVQKFVEECSTCSAEFDDVAKEAYLIYKNEETGLYHQTFYPNERSMEEKVKLAEKYGVSGIALWALGYEGEKDLTPLESYIQ